jgi:hypothetical protein
MTVNLLSSLSLVSIPFARHSHAMRGTTVRDDCQLRLLTGYLTYLSPLCLGQYPILAAAFLATGIERSNCR